MPLDKSKRLTDTLIQRGYIQPARLLMRWVEFRDRSELLVMLALYILARGAAFRSCRTLTHIYTTEIHNFFFRFLGALVYMNDEFVKLPANMAELKNKKY